MIIEPGQTALQALTFTKVNCALNINFQLTKTIIAGGIGPILLSLDLTSRHFTGILNTDMYM